MAALNKALALIGAAKQTGKGAAAAAPVFSHGLTGGKLVVADITQGRDESTSGTRASAQANRTGVACGVDFSSRAYPKSLGLWLYAALGNKSVSGTGPYTHIFSLGDDLPYLTVFGSYNGAFYSVADCKVDQLAVKFDGRSPLDVNLTLGGTVPGFPGTYVPTTDEKVADFFRPVGGTFQLDVDGTTLATARVTGGEFNVKNNLAAVQPSAQITNEDQAVGAHETDCTIKVVPTDLLDWRTILTGSAAGATASNVPVVGSFDFLFVNGNDTLRIAGTRVPFLCDFPEVDPKGGPVELELKGEPLLPTSGTISPFVFTLVNGQATY